jgi:hypothetical protein
MVGGECVVFLGGRVFLGGERVKGFARRDVVFFFLKNSVLLRALVPPWFSFFEKKYVTCVAYARDVIFLFY